MEQAPSGRLSKCGSTVRSYFSVVLPAGPAHATVPPFYQRKPPPFDSRPI